MLRLFKLKTYRLSKYKIIRDGEFYLIQRSSDGRCSDLEDTRYWFKLGSSCTRFCKSKDKLKVLLVLKGLIKDE